MPAPAPCPHYPDCVGCAFIGRPYTEQLAAKRQRVAAAMAEHRHTASVEVPAVIGSQRVFGYRNQAKLVARADRAGLRLGVYRPGTHQVVDIGRCAVHDPLINAVLARVREAAESLRVPIYDERSGEGWLRYVVVRASGWKKTAQLIVVVTDRDWRGEPRLIERLRRIRGVSSVVLNLNRSRGNVIFGRRFIPVTRETALLERVGGLKLRSGAGAFLQANIGVARRVYEWVWRQAAVQPDETAVDLYAGVGAISFYLAAQAQMVIGVEENPIAVLDAKQNIRLNGYHNVRFIEAQSAEGLSHAATMLDRIDVVTLNPPRKGADQATCEGIAACRPSRIVYVSCEPTTLARDLDWLCRHGYAVAGVQPFDMLPQTEHIECVAHLTRR